MTDARRVERLHQRSIPQPDRRAHIRTFYQSFDLRFIEYARQLSFLLRERNASRRVVQDMPALTQPAKEQLHGDEPVLDRRLSKRLFRSMLFLQVDQKGSQM